MIFTIAGGCKTGHAHALIFVDLVEGLGEKVPGLVDLKCMVGSLVLSLLFVL